LAKFIDELAQNEKILLLPLHQTLNGILFGIAKGHFKLKLVVSAINVIINFYYLFCI
jgi:hypothetical protein